MHFTYCPHCGQLLSERAMGDEGMVPWCDTCQIPLFDMFSTCVICAVVNEFNEVALIREHRYADNRLICVSGYMKPGESAEETVRREIAEEIGQTVDSLTYIKSHPLPRHSMLMLCFKARVTKKPFVLSEEISSAEWASASEALSRIRENSLAWQLVKAALESPD